MVSLVVIRLACNVAYVSNSRITGFITQHHDRDRVELLQKCVLDQKEVSVCKVFLLCFIVSSDYYIVF